MTFAALAALLASPRVPAFADTELAAAGAPLPPRITSKARLTVQIGQDAPGAIVLGLYGEDAPGSVALFRDLCGGTLPGLPGVGFRGSLVSKVERDRRIVAGRPTAGGAQEVSREIDGTGYVRSTLVDRAERFTNSDANGLSHDRAGLLSMRRGGGEFEFTLVPAPNPGLDGELVVIGEVLEGVETLRALNAVPTREDKSGLTAAYAGLAKAGGDVRARVETVGKPLRKCVIVEAAAL